MESRRVSRKMVSRVISNRKTKIGEVEKPRLRSHMPITGVDKVTNIARWDEKNASRRGGSCSPLSEKTA